MWPKRNVWLDRRRFLVHVLRNELQTLLPSKARHDGFTGSIVAQLTNIGLHQSCHSKSLLESHFDFESKIRRLQVVIVLSVL